MAITAPTNLFDINVGLGKKDLYGNTLNPKVQGLKDKMDSTPLMSVPGMSPTPFDIMSVAKGKPLDQSNNNIRGMVLPKEDATIESLPSRIESSSKEATKNSFLLSLKQDVDAGAPVDDLVGLYQELPADIVSSIVTDLQAGAPIKDIMRLYPELENIQTPESIKKDRDIKPLFNPIGQLGQEVLNAKDYAKENGSFLTSNKLTQAGMGVAGSALKGVGNLGAGAVGLFSDAPTNTAEDVFNLTSGTTSTVANVFAMPAIYAVNAGMGMLPDRTQKAVVEGLDYMGGIMAKTPGLKEWMEELPEDRRDEFKQELAANTIGLVFGLKGKSNIVKDPKRFIVDNINPVEIARNFNENIIGMPSRYLSKAKIQSPSLPNAIKSDNIRYYLGSLVDLPKDLVKQRESNPNTSEMVKKAVEEIDLGGPTQDIRSYSWRELEKIGDDLESLIQRERDERIGSSSVYKELRKDKTPIDTRPIVSEIDTILEDSSTTTQSLLKEIDPRNFNKTWSILKGEATISQIHDARKGMQALFDKARAANDMGDAEVFKKIKDVLDKRLKSNPLRKEADEKMTRLSKEYDEVTENIVYKIRKREGEIKDNIDSIIKNINNPARRKIKDRIMKIMPDIESRVEAVNQMEQILRMYTTPPKGLAIRVVGSILLGALGGVTGGVTGGATGVMLGSALAGLGAESIGELSRKALIRASIKKQSPVALKKADEIAAKIAEGEEISKQEFESIKDLVDRIKNSIPKSDTKTQKEVKELSTAIMLKAEGMLEDGITGEGDMGVMTSTPKTTRTLGPGATQQTNRPGSSITEGVMGDTLPTTNSNITPQDDMNTVVDGNTNKKVKSETVKAKASGVKAPKELAPLYEEARKYKSADEFGDAMIEKFDDYSQEISFIQSNRHHLHTKSTKDLYYDSSGWGREINKIADEIDSIEIPGVDSKKYANELRSLEEAHFDFPDDNYRDFMSVEDFIDEVGSRDEAIKLAKKEGIDVEDLDWGHLDNDYDNFGGKWMIKGSSERSDLKEKANNIIEKFLGRLDEVSDNVGYEKEKQFRPSGFARSRSILGEGSDNTSVARKYENQLHKIREEANK